MESEKILKEITEKTPVDIDDEDNNENLDANSKSSKFLKRGRIFIRNLSFAVTELKLRNLFSKYGEIQEFNLPYNTEKKMLKGFCFIQYNTRKEALIAIKELNGKNLDNRKLDISIAQPKNEYVPLPKIETAENINKKLRASQSEEKKNEVSEVKPFNQEKKPFQQKIENDPTRTLFIRNLGFNTNEETLKTLFSKYGNTKYCLICKNKETNTSKGSGFVMFEKREDLENVMKIFNKYETNKDYSGINPFELEGRNLKLFNAISKDDAVKNKETKQTEDNQDNRNRELIYYGLNNYYDFVNKEQVSEEDKDKRENIIQLKKTNFKKNPNLHVSETRLVLRNLDKTFDEKKIKEILSEKTEEFMKSLTTNPTELKVYKKVKKIKQIKLMRDEKTLDKDNNPKSKSVAFVEVCDKDFGKWLINNISNVIVSKNKTKGLIMDFSLDDIRKIRNRMIKLEKTQLLNKTSKDAKLKEKKKKSKSKDKDSKKTELELNENKEDKENKTTEEVETEKEKKNVESIDTITDINRLAEIYQNTLSRGKKQRIKKRIKALGESESVLGKPKEMNFGKVDKNLIKNKNKFFDKNTKEEDTNTVDEANTNNLIPLKKKKNEPETYTIMRLDKQNMNINKQIKQQIKKDKKGHEEDPNKLTEKKRNRSENDSKSKEKKKNHSKDKLEFTVKEKEGQNKKSNSSKKIKTSRKQENFDDDNDEDDFEMSNYISKIEQNLRK